MKTIGLIGGMSWESTLNYYKIINEYVKENLGGLHSAKIILFSVDFAEIEEYQEQGEWEKCGEILADAAKKLENAGADFIAICTNTMHKVVPQIEKQIGLPIIHIADATANDLKEHKVKKIAMLGTKYTMTQSFNKDRIAAAGIEVIVPDEKDIQLINSVIYNELCCGIISDQSKRLYIDIISKLQNQGAEGIILGCTEIGLLIKEEDVELPLFDTTVIHAQKIAELSIS